MSYMRDPYICFDLDTGRILHLSYYSDNELPEEAKAVHLKFTESGAPDLYYVEKGVITPKLPKPTEHHIFDYTIKDWIDPRTPETEWPLIRYKRDTLLEKCDWTQLPDVPLLTKEVWAVYRQALRDITLQPDPFNIVWPESPT